MELIVAAVFWLLFVVAACFWASAADDRDMLADQLAEQVEQSDAYYEDLQVVTAERDTLVAEVAYLRAKAYEMVGYEPGDFDADE